MAKMEIPVGYEEVQTTMQEFKPEHDHQKDVLTMNPFLLDQDEVIIRQVPEKLNYVEGQTFLRQIRKLLNGSQPRFVFDFTQVRDLDVVGVDLLLQCLDEVMKLNGDVKLAAVPPGPAAVLELTGVNRLFEIFDSTADAVQSFHRFFLQDETTELPLCADETRSIGETAGFAAD